jgi:hypothetical protein
MPPVVRRDAAGNIEQGALLDTIAWFIERDPRVGVIRHPHVEELFQWKQDQSPDEAATFRFNSAEDRLAIGIHQAPHVHDTEIELHSWISQLLATLDEARGIVESFTEEYKLDTSAETSALERANGLPGAAERNVFLTACWLEVLCTAEARVLGWIYQSLYERPFLPDNYTHH